MMTNRSTVLKTVTYFHVLYCFCSEFQRDSVYVYVLSGVWLCCNWTDCELRACYMVTMLEWIHPLLLYEAPAKVYKKTLLTIFTDETWQSFESLFTLFFRFFVHKLLSKDKKNHFVVTFIDMIQLGLQLPCAWLTYHCPIMNPHLHVVRPSEGRLLSWPDCRST